MNKKIEINFNPFRLARFEAIEKIDYCGDKALVR